MLRLAFVMSALLLAVNAADARVGWFGRAVLTKVAGAACAEDGISAGEVFDTAFLPSAISDNGTQTFITFYANARAISFAMTGRPVANRAYTAVRINSYGKYSTGLTGKVTAFSAPAFTAASPFVTMTISFSDWEGTVGCTATLNVSSTLRQ